jgi:prepilin-type N-terminal cleavage/methylation domain-containing protein
MLNKLKKPNNQGFTIIEVMIVLAIAGLILLIVFLAVPALQRNSRNTQRKNDVAGLLAAVSEFSNNNNGALPNTCSGTTPVTINSTVVGLTSSQARVGYYNLGCAAGPASAVSRVGVLNAFAVVGPYSSAANDRVSLVPAAQCAAGGVTVAGSGRQWAAIYEIENGAGTYAPSCQDS